MTLIHGALKSTQRDVGDILQHLLKSSTKDTHTRAQTLTRITHEKMVILEHTVFNYMCCAKGKTDTHAQTHRHTDTQTHTHTHTHTLAVVHQV